MGRALSGQVPISAPRCRHKFSTHPCIYSQFKLHKSNPFGCTFIPYSYHINTICFVFGIFWQKIGDTLFTKVNIHTHTLTFLSINKKHTHTDTHTLTFSISYWMALQYQATFNLICRSATQKLRVCIPMAIYYSVWANK